MEFKTWLTLSESLPDDLHRRLKHFFSRPEPYKILDACNINGTFQAGACWIGAKAIVRYLKDLGVKAELYAIWDRGRSMDDEESPELIQQHVVVKVDNSYLDSDGVHTAQQILNKMIKWEGLKSPVLSPFDPKMAGEIITNKSAVSRLYRSLSQALATPSATQ